MPMFIVTKKLGGTEVYRYQADAPIEWSGMEFASHEHTEYVEASAPEAPTNPSEWYINIGPFFDRFGAFKLPILASGDPLVQAVIKDSSVRKYIDLKGRRAELQQVIGLLQSKGFAVSAVAVLDAKPSADEAALPAAVTAAEVAHSPAVFVATHSVLMGEKLYPANLDGDTVRLLDGRWTTVSALIAIGAVIKEGV